MRLPAGEAGPPAGPLGLPAAEDSLRRRYAFKLANNVVGSALDLVAVAVIPRSLGPAAFGDFNFLSSFFSQVVGFFDGGTSTAFYTKLSQRPRDVGLLKFYWFYGAGIAVAVALLVVAARASGAAA